MNDAGLWPYELFNRLLKELAMKLRVIPGCRPPHACKDSAFRISTALLSAACLLWPVSVLTGCDRSTSAAVSGVIEAHRVTVSAELGGRILSVSTQEGAVVQAGDVLLTLDCVVTQAQLDQARAALAQATAQVEQTVAQQQLIADGARPQEIEAAQADVTSAEQALRMGRRGATRDQRAQLEAALEGVRARQALAQATVLRLDTLTVAGSSTEAQRDAANTELAVLNAEEQRLLAALAEAESGARPEEAAILEQRLQQAQARLSALQEGARAPERTVADAVHSAALAQQQSAEAATAAAQAQVDRCTVRAPVAGTIEIMAIEQGEFVTPATPLVAISPEGPLQVRTWVTQNRLGSMAPGTQLPVTPDSWEGSAALWGTVRQIADQAEFTAGNVQTPDDRMVLVYRMELELPADVQGVRPGMTVSVDLDAARPAQVAP